MQPPTLPKRRTWSGAALILCILGILTLLFFDQLASRIVAILGLLLAFLALPVGNPPQPVLQRIPPALQDILTKWKDEPRGTRARNVAIFLLGAGIAISLIFIFIFRPGSQTQIANQVEIEKGEEMTNGSVATIRFTEKIPDRKNLDLSLRLENTIGTGDCYQSAMMTLESTVNGAPKPPVNTKGRQGQATIVLGREARDLAIRVKLRVDEGCRMRLSVTNATFYNSVNWAGR